MLYIQNYLLIIASLVKRQTSFRYVVFVNLKTITEVYLKCTIYQFVVSVNFLQLFSHLQCPIWASVVNNDYLVFISTVKIKMKNIFIE